MGGNQCFSDAANSGTFDSDLKNLTAPMGLQDHTFIPMQSSIKNTHAMQGDFFFSIPANVALDRDARACLLSCSITFTGML